jgi:hypothetical protein
MQESEAFASSPLCQQASRCWQFRQLHSTR